MDNRKLMIVLGFAAFMLLVLGFLLKPGKSSRSPAGQKGSFEQKAANSQKPDSGRASGARAGQGAGGSDASASGAASQSSRRAPSGTSSSVPGYTANLSNSDMVPRRAYSEKEMQELRRKREQRRSEVYARKQKWLADQVNNDKLSAKSRYQYRLKLIEGYRSGNEAFNKGDYAEALKEYMNALKDPEANAETRFTCMMSMQSAAKALKDYDLYLEILKQQAQLIENEDLNIFGIRKGKGGWPLYESRKNYITVIKDPGKIDDVVAAIIEKRVLLIDKDKDEVKKKFLQDLEEFKNDFETARRRLNMGEEEV